jgi:hypothetical protein
MSTGDPESSVRPRLVVDVEPLLVGADFRARQVVLSRRFDPAGSLAGEIAQRLQIVADPDAPAGLAIVAAPEGRQAVPLLPDVADRLEQLSEQRGIPVNVLVDAVLNDWLADQRPSAAGGGTGDSKPIVFG